MIHLAVWILAAVPKQSCIDSVIAQRSAAVAEFIEVAKSTENVSGISAARAKIDALPTIPTEHVAMNVVKPDLTGHETNPCYDFYIAKIDLDKVGK